MSESPENSSSREVVEAQAAAWLVQHDRGLTPAQQDEFLQWLAAHPGHRESFARHRRMWSDFNLLAQWRPEHSAEPNPDLLARPRRHRFWLASPLLAAAAVVAVLIAWSPSLRERQAAPVVFEADSYRREILPDGSRIEMNRGAHLVLQFTAKERRLLLIEGEAKFEVAKNPAMPFVVRAGGVDVRAIGTVFNVKLAGTNLELLVTEGTVHVAQNPATPKAANDHLAAEPGAVVLAELSAGQRTVIPVAAVVTPPPIIAASSEEIERLLDWRPRLLDFNSVPLPTVIAEFNRRNVTQIVLVDESLKDVPIVASIRSDNVEGFVRLLEATAGVRAERRQPGEILLRRDR